jgi:hypothetical protein
MSLHHLTLVRDMTLKGPPRALLMALADRANDSGECWPSITTLAKECGFCRSTVKSSLRALKDAKLIDWKQRRDTSGDLTSNVYSLTLGGRAGADPPRAGAGRQVGQELTKGRAGAGHKASKEASIKSYTRKFRKLS